MSVPVPGSDSGLEIRQAKDSGLAIHQAKGSGSAFHQVLDSATLRVTGLPTGSVTGL
jgi:hypothetical protein